MRGLSKIMWLKIWLIVGLLGLFFLLILGLIVGTGGGGDSSSCDIDSATTDSAANLSGASTGNWADKNSKQYQAAKEIWDTLTKKEGFSGAGAAGAIGNAIGESGLKVEVINAYGFGGLFQWSETRFKGAGFVKVGDKSTYTLENQIKTMQYELHHGWKKTRTSVGKATDVKTATLNWFYDFEGMRGHEDQYGNQRDSGAQWAYREFGGSNIQANDSLLSDISTTADTGENAVAQDTEAVCDDIGDSDSDIINKAKKLLGYFTYQQLHGVSYIGSIEEPDKNGVTDCSGFVWLVLAQAGYKVPANMGWYTGSMESDAKGAHKYLKEISADEAQAGDIVIVNTGSGSGDNGHTAFLEEKWQGDKTKVIQESGPTGVGKVREGRFGESFKSLTDEGGKPVFARPIVKDAKEGK